MSAFAAGEHVCHPTSLHYRMYLEKNQSITFAYKSTTLCDEKICLTQKVLNNQTDPQARLQPMYSLFRTQVYQVTVRPSVQPDTCPAC